MNRGFRLSHSSWIHSARASSVSPARMISQLGALIVASVASAACGPPPAPPAPPKPLVVEKPVAVEKPVDLSPVPAPERIVFVAQIKKPNDIKKTLGDWTRFPMPGGESLAEAALGKPVGDIVDMDQPIRAVGIITGTGKKAKPTFVGSIPLTSFDQAKRQIEGVYSLSAVDNGDFEIKGVESDGGEDDKRTCFLAHAAGPSNAALVCGFGPETQKLVAYMVRTAVKEVPERDLHVELRMAPAKDELRMAMNMLPAGLAAVMGNESPATIELMEAGAADVSDFVLDIDKLTLDSTFGDKALQTDFATTFETRKSLVTQLGLSHADKNAPPPAALWHLPSDTDFAMWGSGIDGKLVEHPKDLVMRAISQAAKDKKMSDADSHALSDALSHTLALTSSPSLYAKGYDENALKAAVEKERDVSALPRETVAQAIGWHLWRFEEPIAKVGPAAKEWASAWSRPTFQKWAKEHVSKDHLATLKVVPANAALKLPKDTVHIEISLPVDSSEGAVTTASGPAARVPMNAKQPKPDAKPVAKPAAKSAPQKPVVVHVFVLPDAGASTMAIGLDEKLVAGKALASLSTSPDNETLKGRQGYDALRDVRASAGGFVTMHAVVGAARMGDDPTRRLAGLSNNARTPIVFSFASSGAGNGAMTTSIRVPKDFVLDVMKMGMR
jgi:hypothetical protein